jgi:hypothetical protein
MEEVTYIAMHCLQGQRGDTRALRNSRLGYCLRRLEWHLTKPNAITSSGSPSLQAPEHAENVETADSILENLLTSTAASQHLLLLDLSYDPYGCRALQLLLRGASPCLALRVVNHLTSHVVALATHLCGNFVVQCVVRDIHEDFWMSALLPELLQNFSVLAHSMCGCRAFVRILERGGGRSAAAVSAVVAQRVPELIASTYGHHLLEVCIRHLSWPRELLREALLAWLEAKTDNAVGDAEANVLLTFIECPTIPRAARRDLARQLQRISRGPKWRLLRARAAELLSSPDPPDPPEPT